MEEANTSAGAKPLAHIDTVLFDLDGTLVDTVDLIHRSFDHAVKTVLGRNLSREELLKNLGRPLLVQMESFSREKSAELMDAYNRHNLANHDALISAYPHTEETLAWLKNEMKVKLAIVTSKKRDLSLRGLEITGLLKYMDLVIAMEDTTHHKPEPEPVLAALKGLGAEAERAIFIGDSPFDMAAGRTAGTLIGAALWGPFAPELLAEFSPELVLKNLAELRQYL